MTVTGPVARDELGFTLPHEHVLIDLGRAKYRWDQEGVLIDPAVAIEELKSYKEAGGDALIEMTTDDFGRNPEGLLQVASKTGVRIVMGTGWYREPYYPEWIDRRSTTELADIIIREIREGVGESGIKPGVIGEIGSDKAWISAQEERVFRAAGRAQRETNLGLMTHAPAGAAMAQLRILKEEGVDLTRVAVGHADALMNLDYHLNIIATGAFASFDLVGQSAYPDHWRARQIAQLVMLGHARSLLISMDLCHRSRLKAWGGAGYSYLLDRFLPMLSSGGVTADAIRQITVRNPARFLTGTD